VRTPAAGSISVEARIEGVPGRPHAIISIFLELSVPCSVSLAAHGRTPDGSFDGVECHCIDMGCLGVMAAGEALGDGLLTLVSSLRTPALKQNIESNSPARAGRPR